MKKIFTSLFIALLWSGSTFATNAPQVNPATQPPMKIFAAAGLTPDQEKLVNKVIGYETGLSARYVCIYFGLAQECDSPIMESLQKGTPTTTPEEARAFLKLVNEVGINDLLRPDAPISKDVKNSIATLAYQIQDGSDSLTLGETIPPKLLGKITDLKNITFIGTKIKDLSVLNEMNQLENLILKNTDVSALTPLKELPNLKALILVNNLNLNFTSIKDLLKLEKLDIRQANFKDLNPLKNLINLTELVIHSDVNNIEPLKNLVNLKNLDLLNAQVDDVSPLKGLPNLERIRLENTPAINSAGKLETVRALFPRRVSIFLNLNESFHGTRP